MMQCNRVAYLYVTASNCLFLTLECFCIAVGRTSRPAEEDDGSQAHHFVPAYQRVIGLSHLSEDNLAACAAAGQSALARIRARMAQITNRPRLDFVMPAFPPATRLRRRRGRPVIVRESAGSPRRATRFLRARQHADGVRAGPGSTGSTAMRRTQRTRLHVSQRIGAPDQRQHTLGFNGAAAATQRGNRPGSAACASRRCGSGETFCRVAS